MANKIEFKDIILLIQQLDGSDLISFNKQKAQLMAKVAIYGSHQLCQGMEYRDSLEPQLTEIDVYKSKEVFSIPADDTENLSKHDINYGGGE